MQVTRGQIEQLLKLFHVQTNTYINLPPNLFVIHIGKRNDRIPPNIDVSNLPNSNVVSRIHANILVEGSHYFIEDLGSINGTYLNHSRLTPLTRHQLNIGDRIDLCKDNQVTFIFQLAKNVSTPARKAEDDEEEQVALFTKLLGLALLLGALGFLSSSVVLDTYLYNHVSSGYGVGSVSHSRSSNFNLRLR